MRFIFSVLLTLCINALSSEVLLLEDGTLYAGKEMKKLTGYDLLIKDGLIIDIGKDLKNVYPQKIDKLIKLEGKIVTPGFIAPYSHLGLVEIDMIPETRDDSSSLYSSGFSISQAFNPSSTLIPHNLNGGITSAISAPQSRGLFGGLASAFSLSGEPDSLIKKDIALVASIYTGSESKAANLQLMEDSISYARNFNPDNNKDLKNFMPDGVFFSNRDLISLKRVADKQIPMIIRVDRASDILYLIEFSKRLEINIIFTGVSEGWMVADAISQANIPVIIEPINNLPSSFDKLGSRLENAALLNKAGVRLLFKSDNYDTHNAYLSRQGAGIAVSYGLSWIEAIKALSVNIADVFKLEGMGVIKRDYQADLIIWDQDPLEVTSYPEKVFIEGKLMSSSTRSKQLRDRYLNLN